MSFSTPPPKRYEEYAFVIDFISHGNSIVIKGREGNIVLSIGEERLTLLEMLAADEAVFEVGERVNIGKEGRQKIISVLGRLSYDDLTSDAQNDLPAVVEKIVTVNEQRFVEYFNKLQPVTPRLHALELIPGIGKTLMLQILNEREKKPFESFEDIRKRVGIREPAKLLGKRIIEEISGGSRINLFVR